MMMINRNLSIFIQVATCGSITKAAKLLYITQPAVSNAIAKLEEELGVKLFFRDKRNGLLLTDVGKKILSLATQLEDIDNRIYQTAQQEKNLISGQVRIAVLTSLVSTILSGALKKYRKQYPDIDIEIKEGTPIEIFEMIENRSADFAISCSPFGKFHSFLLCHDRMTAMFPPGSKEGQTVQLSNPPDILIINKPAYETLLEHMTPEKIKFDKMLLVQNAETAIRMVEDGVGIGIISEYTMETLAYGVKKYPVNPNIQFEIGLFANDLNDLTPAAAELVRIIKENFL